VVVVLLPMAVTLEMALLVAHLGQWEGLPDPVEAGLLPLVSAMRASGFV
jgi:hypothetical protein